MGHGRYGSRTPEKRKRKSDTPWVKPQRDTTAHALTATPQLGNTSTDSAELGGSSESSRAPAEQTGNKSSQSGKAMLRNTCTLRTQCTRRSRDTSINTLGREDRSGTGGPESTLSPGWMTTEGHSARRFYRTRPISQPCRATYEGLCRHYKQRRSTEYHPPPTYTLVWSRQRREASSRSPRLNGTTTGGT